MRKSKDPIKLRMRKLRNGNVSLYLDLCIDNRREYEFLKLYLIPERTKEDRDKNRETLALAEAVRAERIVQLRNNRFGFKGEQKVAYLLPILQGLKEKNRSYHGIRVRLERRITDKFTTDKITPAWVRSVCRDIANESTIKMSSRNAYLSHFRFVLRRLAKEGFIGSDALEAWHGCPNEQAKRAYLTAEELSRLMQTPCTRKVVHDMFLFACFCGLRFCDCSALTWAQVEDTSSGSRIVFRQQKTRQLEYLDINSDARSYMGERGADKDSVFEFIEHRSVNGILGRWVKSAGIGKHITFHCARHTFATLLLSADTNIMVVSRLLGHTSVTTTEIYAKVMDKDKRKAVDNLSALVRASSHGKVTDTDQQIATNNDETQQECV